MSEDRIKAAGLKLGDLTRPLTKREQDLAYTAREAAVNAVRTYEDLVHMICSNAAGRDQDEQVEAGR